MPNTHTLRKIALASVLAATAVMAQTPYDEGQKALRDQQWMKAVEQFETAVKEDGEKADAATYWMAYAYYKANRAREGERELRRLERKYPDSPWLKEAQALRLEHQDPEQSASKIESGDLELDEEMRLFVLMQLMERDPERTRPLVMDMVYSAETDSVRRDALFLLAMNDDEASQEALFAIARDSKDPKLQRQAIEMLGVMEATSELHALYPTQNRETRKVIIESLSIAGDSAMLHQILASETDPELRKSAIFGIAMHDGHGAGEYATELYANAESVEEKEAVLESLIMMDDATDLALEILKTESDPRLQMQAIHILGVMDATEELGDLYANIDDRNVRMAVLEALSIAEDSDALVKILANETDRKLRGMAVQMLAINGSPEAAEYLVEMYPSASPEEKKDIIHSMLILDDKDALVNLMKQEEDPKLKREMLQMLVMMGSENIDDELFEMLEDEK